MKMEAADISKRYISEVFNYFYYKTRHISPVGSRPYTMELNTMQNLVILDPPLQIVESFEEIITFWKAFTFWLFF